MMKGVTSLPIEQVVLEDGAMSVSLLSYGAITQGWWIGETPLILGYPNPQEYLTDPYFLGAIVGRVANRIGGAKFNMQDAAYRLTANEGENTLHGGVVGLSRSHWIIRKTKSNRAVLSLTSPDGADGFPGEIRFEIHVELAFPRLTYTITAWPDRPTPISIAQHNYYSLGCHSSILDSRLTLNSKRVLELDDSSTPTGVVDEIENQALDFSSPRVIGDEGRGLDHYFVFEEAGNFSRPVATVETPSGLRMNIYSDQPGAQVYSAAHLSDPFRPCAGLCIEPSGYTDAVNHPLFPSVIYSPDNPYKQVLTLEIAEDQA